MKSNVEVFLGHLLHLLLWTVCVRRCTSWEMFCLLTTSLWKTGGQSGQNFVCSISRETRLEVVNFMNSIWRGLNFYCKIDFFFCKISDKMSVCSNHEQWSFNQNCPFRDPWGRAFCARVGPYWSYSEFQNLLLFSWAKIRQAKKQGKIYQKCVFFLPCSMGSCTRSLPY